ncbi:hypothetical protein BGW80DRAFT_471777 [Lactifluus volemus]|nr:hypothetical protein BGW80DRAFT_471777 [Lactifluus volemus]
MFPFTIIVLFTLIALAQAVLQVKRQPVTDFVYPNEFTIWNVRMDKNERLVWRSPEIPPNSDLTGRIFLGYGYLENGTEHLDCDHPLVMSVPLNGETSIPTPNVPPRTDYFVFMDGNSTGRSQRFTITGGSSSGGLTFNCVSINLVKRSSSSSTPLSLTSSPAPRSSLSTTASPVTSASPAPNSGLCTCGAGALTLYATAAVLSVVMVL